MKQIILLAALALTLASCGGKSSYPNEQSKKITPPNISNTVRHDCPAGVFFIKRDPEQPNGAGIALYNHDGKLLLSFNDGILNEWSGDAGLIMRRVKHDYMPYPTNEWFLFSFATLQKKPIGSGALFIKNGNFILSRDGSEQMFWSLAGDLIYSGSVLQSSYLNTMEQDFWVSLSFSDRPSIWLDLATGNILPQNYGESYPNVEQEADPEMIEEDLYD